jgi:hypothetical protein
LEFSAFIVFGFRAAKRQNLSRRASYSFEIDFGLLENESRVKYLIIYQGLKGL